MVKDMTVPDVFSMYYHGKQDVMIYSNMSCTYNFKITKILCISYSGLTPFDIGGGGHQGGHDGPPNVFDHCAQTLRRRKLKLGDFYY